MILIRGNVERIAEAPAMIERLKGLGYKPTDTEDASNTDQNVPETLEALKVPELRKLAKEKGIEGADSLNRDELLKVLKEVV